MGEIITFYSYKGGVGRTMALANTAILLSQWGYRVLVIDWDLEAPGLEHFFRQFLEGEQGDFDEMVKQQPGIIDILLTLADDPAQETTPWQEYLIPVMHLSAEQTEEQPEDQQGVLHLLTAGSRDEHYFSRLRNLDVKTLYERGGGHAIEQLRNEWKETYDYTLIDSRTGVTDIGGICTIQLPDMLVLLFTATEQSLYGVIDIAQKANRSRWNVPFDRMTLVSLPIPSKFDSGEEFRISQEWLDRFDQALAEIYASWLPKSVKRRDFLQLTKIPYISYFSFGEKLPVLEQGTLDPAGLGYAYETLAALMTHKLESVQQLIENRSEFVRTAHKNPLPTFPALEGWGYSSRGVSLTGEQMKQVHDALIDAFPTRRDLARMARFEFSANLSMIAEGDSLADNVFSLIEWAEAQGRLDELITQARNANPQNEQLRNVAQSLTGRGGMMMKQSLSSEQRDSPDDPQKSPI